MGGEVAQDEGVVAFFAGVQFGKGLGTDVGLEDFGAKGGVAFEGFGDFINFRTPDPPELSMIP